MSSRRVNKRKSDRRVKDLKNTSESITVPDLVHLIRSIQRLEGQPDCFGQAVSDCHRICPWREYCLKPSVTGFSKKK
jgi:hypothetical protein